MAPLLSILLPHIFTLIFSFPMAALDNTINTEVALRDAKIAEMGELKARWTVLEKEVAKHTQVSPWPPCAKNHAMIRD